MAPSTAHAESYASIERREAEPIEFIIVRLMIGSYATYRWTRILLR